MEWRSAVSKLPGKPGVYLFQDDEVRTSKSFPALEWLAAMCSHIPNRGKPMVWH